MEENNQLIGNNNYMAEQKRGIKRKRSIRLIKPDIKASAEEHAAWFAQGTSLQCTRLLESLRRRKASLNGRL